MSFFTHSSVLVQGGTFYSAAGDVNTQNDQQMTIAAASGIYGDSVPGGTPPALGFSQGGPPSGPMRSPQSRIETGRFHPYDIAGRRAARPSSTPQHPSFETPYTLPASGSSSGRNGYATSLPNSGPNGYYTPFPSDGSQPENGAPAPWPNVNPPYPKSATTIHNGTFIGGNVNNTVRHGESGISILHRVSAPEAFHDSPDSHDNPRCHPETRIEMQKKLSNWCLRAEWPHGWGEAPLETEPTVLWVHGPAGAGKTVIMRTLAQRLEDEGRLGGTFFFKRAHATRGNARALFPTIALQLAVSSARLKPRISQIVEENPTLLGKAIDVQLSELILNPCIGFQGAARTIIIDGLDECEGQKVQQDIIRLILDSTRERAPLRFVIASRREAHLREVLDELSFHGSYRKFDVESCFEDVRRYFVAEFARIHSEHKTLADIPRPWPSQWVIDGLVQKSSGYFVYASTVIKFVDDKDSRPTQRLGALSQHLTGTGSQRPFAALDELYTQILCAVPKHHQLVPILRIIDSTFTMPLSTIDMVLELERGDTELCLRGLHSLIKLDDRGPQFYHASFSDFLRDRARAGLFCVEDSGAMYILVKSTSHRIALSLSRRDE
ncbi:hypothetical protein DFH06DRAFT_1485356 [Mycena polygramma]|nr:hypothetical protein DFH06DRAFT_1485356 [Mycena polygramma]